MKYQRDVVFAVLTLLVAELLVFGAYHAVAHVRELNAARLFTTVIMSGPSPSLLSPEHNIFPGVPMMQPDDASRQEMKWNQQASAYTEAVVMYWERMMYGVGAWMIVAGLLSVALSIARPLHLLTGVVVLASAAATLVAIMLLCDPDKGGMEPLSVGVQCGLVGLQGFYGLVLLIAFVRRASVVGGANDRM